MALQARIEQESAEERGQTRFKLRLTSAGSVGAEGAPAVTVHELSTSGFLIETEQPLAIGSEVSFMLPVVGPVAGEIVWGSGNFVGGQFRSPLSRDAVSAALSASRIVWPEFSASSAADRGAPRVPTRVHEPEPAEPALPLSSRIQIIFGSSLLLWSLIVASGWLVIQALN